MPRLVALLAALALGVAVGGLTVDGWRAQPEPVAAPAPSEQEVQALNQQVARLAADTSRLQVEAGAAAERERALQAEVGRLGDENRQLQARLAETESQLTVALSARNHLAEQLTAAQEDAAALRQNLAFFEQLIPEGSKPASVSIRSVDITRQGEALQYRVLVMRNRPAADEFSGTLQFVATGTRGGRGATIPLERLASAPISGNTRDGADSAPSSAPATLQFKQYQRVSGLLAIPPGFEPESVTVRVLEGKSVRSEHTVGLTPKE